MLIRSHHGPFQVVVCSCVWFCWVGFLSAADGPWQRHVIDGSLQGADGVRLADANHDGLPDIATGWEEGGKTRVYLHPGSAMSRETWPYRTIGSTPSVEDAVWVDFDRDGNLDVLCSCEGKEQSLRVFFSPGIDGTKFVDAKRWEMKNIPAADKRTRWMFCLPVPNGREPDYVVVASKNPHGMVGLLKPGRGRSVQECRIKKLCDADWVMSLVNLDVDRDGDSDIVFSDRKGEKSAVYWLENPGGETALATDADWKKHLVGGLGREVMFMQVVPKIGTDQDVDVEHEIVVATKPNSVLWFREGEDCRSQWKAQEIVVGHVQEIGNAKGIGVGDLSGDGNLDLVYSCESATEPRSGVVMFSRVASGTWELTDISGPQGIKFDLIELVDIDRDGDLDVLTCEERHEKKGLGVIWYQNPN